MANQTAYYRDDSGKTLYAFPFSQDPTDDVADWNTYRVQLVETPASSENYQASLNDSVARLWRIFEGADQPASLAEALDYVIELDPRLTAGALQTDVDLGKTYREVGDETPIEFAWPVAGATITGTLGDGTALAGAISFVQTEGGIHWYRLAYDAADRPDDGSPIGYVFTDGTYTRTASLILQTGKLSTTALTQLQSLDDAIIIRRIAPLRNAESNYLELLQDNDYLVDNGQHEDFETGLVGAASDYTAAVSARNIDDPTQVISGVVTLETVASQIVARVGWPRASLTHTGKYSWSVRTTRDSDGLVQTPVMGTLTIIRDDFD